MLTKNEITALNLSPTKKDFVQIWNELLEVAGKLSERWDPTSTNESDPGIVILKALTGIADKLNYNIDKNTLEAFMPTAAQEDSMRKLCEMLGYNIKYYQSAKTEITIKYHNPEPSVDEKETMEGLGLLIPKFSVITNNDKDVSYFIIDDDTYRAPGYISASEPSKPFICMEGQLVKCESTSDNYVITSNQISSNNRFYLPETQIAENGIFIYNVDTVNSGADGEAWKKVDNLNIQVKGSKVFKFGFDSYESRPYIEFPEDYSELFNEGLFIYYTRTNGINGNISPRTLTQLELPSEEGWSNVSIESFSVENPFSATTGANIETIQQAYNNFKKTVGTFETLVTCRDYMNKIYTMVNNHNKPYVSNILVTDIRNDLNRAITICSCDDAGIFYKETPIIEPVSKSIDVNASFDFEINKPFFNNVSKTWHLGENGMKLTGTDMISGSKSGFTYSATGEVFKDADDYWCIKQNSNTFKTTLKATTNVNKTVPVTTIVDQPAINQFDIVFYPYRSYSQIKNNVKDIREVYDASFTYSTANLAAIKQELTAGNTKTIAHTIIEPRVGDMVSINNYLRLNATIATNTKVSEDECIIINNNIKIALANAFNMRELDFGEEIPFDSIVSVIENADPRIKVASLNEPDLYTTFSVIDSISNNVPKIKEYAVASNRFTLEDAESTGRLTSTFDTDAAKKLYNKLVVRNILAGRVPLFKYNNTFKTNFSEGAYRVTESLNADDDYIPDDLPLPDDQNLFTIWTEAGAVYTAQYSEDTSDDSAGEDESPSKKIIYQKISTPEEFKDNIITEVDKNDITDIDTYCNIQADEKNEIQNVTLSDGEFIKFKAPNFTTIKTYPAYVNYHLDLNTEIEPNSDSKRAPKNAEAETLFNILNNDWETWSLSNPDIKWQKVLNHFKDVDNVRQTSYVKTFTLTQKISKYTPTSLEDEVTESGSNVTSLKGPIIIQLENDPATDSASKMEELVAESGCVKIINAYDNTKGFKAKLRWQPSGDESVSGDGPDLPIFLDFDNPFITNPDVLNQIQNKINNFLETHKDSEEINLPTECDWTISFDFECVPFNTVSYMEWEKYIKDYNNNGLFEYKPVEENSVVFWRFYAGAYQPGKYIIENGTLGSGKLLKFDRNYFGTLADYGTVMNGIFIAKTLGKDAEFALIKNNEEYKLAQNEYLYIEYTPSTTTEDGTTQELAAITEIYGPGTIIRPSGFETGLMDSDEYKRLGNTPHKTVSFITENSTNYPVEMQRFGANEQVEIRDFAKVTLSKDFSKESSAIYIYKNFNGCDALEKYTLDEETKQRVNNTYTLKDNEYIFYTDENQSEFAYFTNGTQVTLEGTLVIPRCDIVDLNTVFDSGLQEINWQRLYFNSADKLTFQEYQYVTLGAGDTLKSLKLVDDKNYLGSAVEDIGNNTWRFCEAAEYSVATDPNNSVMLPVIDLDAERKGNGWEATSILELNVSKNNSQTLRNNGKIATGLVLANTTSGGSLSSQKCISPEPGQTISFKTNLTCQTTGNTLNIKDVYSNPDKEKGFKLKVFVENKPALIKTEPSKTVPYKKDPSVTDFLTWPAKSGRPLIKNSSELWYSVGLDKLKVVQQDEDNLGFYFDNALMISPSLVTGTYGIFCVYINYTSDNALKNAKTWIEVLPGADHKDFAVLNAENSWETATEAGYADKLYLNKGINCIRINTSGTFFIKTSENSQGILYFDDLRLVNNIVEYLDLSGEKATLTTQGLNLEQLGYLGTSESTVLDAEMYEKTKAECIEKYRESIDSLSQDLNHDFEVPYKALSTVKPKIKTIVSFAEKVKEDLEHILAEYPLSSGRDNGYLKALIMQYQQLHEEISRKETLLLALDENTTMIEQDLVNLLNDFTSIETLQKQLLASLSEAREKATANAKAFSKEDILLDFDSVIKSLSQTEKDELTKELKIASTEKIDLAYSDQLKELADNITKVINSDERNNLLTILNYLQSNKNTDIRTKLTSKVSKLIDALDKSAVTSLLDSAELSYLEDTPESNQQALSTLYKLRELFSTSNIRTVITELEFAINENSDDYLETLVSDLQELLETAEFKTVNEAINDCLLNNDLDKSDKLTKLNTLKTAVTKYYEYNITTIQEELEDLFITFDQTYTEVLSKLDTSTDSQVANILSNLEIISEERNLKLAKKDSFADLPKVYSDLPFGREVVVSVWAKHMEQDLVSGVEELCQLIGALIKNLNIAYTATELLSPFTSESVKDKANFVVFEDLFTQAVHLKQKYDQNCASQELITLISSDLMPFSAEASIAMTEITENNLARNNIIISLIEALSEENISITKKHQIINELKKELKTAIQLDRSLFSIIARLLCPSIALAPENLPEIWSDSFYTNLKAKLKQIEESFLDTSLVSDTGSAVTRLLSSIKYFFNENLISSLLFLLEKSDSEPMKLWLTELDSSVLNADVLLPDVYQTKVIALKNIVDKQAELKAVLTADFLNTSESLTTNNISTWLDNNSTEEFLNGDQLIGIINSLKIEVAELETLEVIPEELKSVFSIQNIEKQLLEEIRELDVHKEFYYNVPIESYLAIEFNEGNGELNTLKNPRTNYDINNINNSFVISKLDIDYLDNGIRIARSSRLS